MVFKGTYAEKHSEKKRINLSSCWRFIEHWFLPQIHVMWTVCGRRWSKSSRAPCGRSGSPSTNSSSTSSSLGRSMRWPRNHPGYRRVPRPAAQDKSSEKGSVVSCHLVSWCCCPVIMRKINGSHRKYPLKVLTCVFLLSELWYGDVLQWGAGAVCPVPSWYIPGHDGSAVLWAVSQHWRTGHRWCQECVSVWR